MLNRPNHYTSDGGLIQFGRRVVRDLVYFDAVGRLPPGPMTRRPFRGSPMYLEDMTWLRHKRTYERWSRKLGQRRCEDCKRPIGKVGWGPMLQKPVWERIKKDPNAYVCDKCTRRRLGRPICPHDLVVCGFNLDNWKWLGGAPWVPEAGMWCKLWLNAPMGVWLKPVRSVLIFAKLIAKVHQQWGGVGPVALKDLKEAEK